ncbi:hypothetical protein MHW47_07185 [Streptomyces sp. OfavH-34-F]|uniref:hypothetical protein n=1 Tax=Streptomyces sp. OfavH-34-F TaxID=2917760 RepID=UPI001EF22C1A|nr:hypothetical protein [Streptomyces sp. OfavH-34-F]MCG7524227.1 hypothetical protein [Streptomyces sp. OfavH-34-F]
MGSPLPGDAPPHDPSRPGGRPGAPDLAASGESLKHFKTRVDRLLTTLDASPAAHGRLGEQRLGTAAYGTDFAEAMMLSLTYKVVHLRLTQLSRTLGEQLEAMGLTVALADRGYENVDQEYADRLHAIQKRVAAGYRRPPAPPATGPALGEGTSSGPEGF